MIFFLNLDTKFGFDDFVGHCKQLVSLAYDKTLLIRSMGEGTSFIETKPNPKLIGWRGSDQQAEP